MFVIRKLKNSLLLLIHIIISKLPSSRIKHYDIIVVRVDLIGDFIMRYDSLQELKKQEAGKSVLLICSDLVKPFVENDVFFADIISFNIKKISGDLRYFFHFSRLLKKYSADIIYFQAWERYMEGDMIISCLRANEILGMKGINDGGLRQKYYDTLYSKLFEFPPNRHELLQIEFFVRSTINPNYDYGRNPMKIEKQDSPDIYTPYVVVSISSSMEEKIWPLDRFAKVIDCLPDDIPVVITGAGKDDSTRVQKILKLVSNKDKIVNYVNKTNVMELAYLISQSLFVIGNDSSAVHIATATRVPSVCVLHGAHYGRFFPYPDLPIEKKFLPHIVNYKMDCYNCDYKCIYADTKPFKCLDCVSVDMVLHELKMLFDELHIKNNICSIQ